MRMGCVPKKECMRNCLIPREYVYALMLNTIRYKLYIFLSSVLPETRCDEMSRGVMFPLAVALWYGM